VHFEHIPFGAELKLVEFDVAGTFVALAVAVAVGTVDIAVVIAALGFTRRIMFLLGRRLEQLG